MQTAGRCIRPGCYLGKRFGRRSGFSAESPLLSDSSRVAHFHSIIQFIYSSLPEGLFLVLQKADTDLVGQTNPLNYLTYSIGFFDGKWHE
jgi:hypothetical protein